MIAAVLSCATALVPPSPLAPDALTLLFPSPILRLSLAECLPEGTLSSLESAVLDSWSDHVAEQDSLPAGGRRADDDHMEVTKARTELELNEEFFYYQKRKFGILSHGSDPNPDGWMASQAAQDLLSAVCASASGYLERVSHHAGLDAGRPWTAEDWELDPDRFQVWASVHTGGSTHPRHVHMGAVLSVVVYVNAPPGAGHISFHDPRGDVPPFENQVRHTPQPGDCLIFPPWISHAVGSSACDEADGPRISISFNLVDEELEGGRYGWGSATTALDVVTLEDDLGLAPWQADEDDEGAPTLDAEGISGADGDDAEQSEGLSRIRAALAAAGREGQNADELRSVLELVQAETEALISYLE